MEREIGVSGRETSNEVIFECLDGSFSKVATVEANGGKFIVYFILVQQ